MSSRKSALNQSRPHSVSKSNLSFNPFVRTLSGNTEIVRLDDIDRHHTSNPRKKGFYRQKFVFKSPYSTNKLAYQPVNPEESWTTSEEFTPFLI